MPNGWEWTTAATADALVDRARRVIPGGSLTRSKKVFGKFAAWADGAVITDTDGRSYIDMMASLGAISLGYRPPPVEGGVYSFPHRIEIDAAEAVVRQVTPWASWVRFTKTGSEATHAAYRIAKAQTGRNTVLRLAGSYHGWHEWCSQSDGDIPVNSAFFPQHVPVSDVAAVVVEPPRFTVMRPEWLRDVRDMCDAIGALLIFDSMIWGGRYAVGGASQYYGVIPDLECFGKAFGNGQAIAFVVGTDRTRPHGEIPSGTFSGETSGLAALVETLKVYAREPVIDTLWARGQQLRDGLQRVVPASLGVWEGSPVCQRVRFHEEAVGQRFCEAMLERGVIWHPLVAFPMYAHTVRQIETVVEAVRQAAVAVA